MGQNVEHSVHIVVITSVINHTQICVTLCLRQTPSDISAMLCDFATRAEHRCRERFHPGLNVRTESGTEITTPSPIIMQERYRQLASNTCS